MKELLEWTTDKTDYIRGYLPGQDQTTLFLLIPWGDGKRVKCTGAFMPDSDEKQAQYVAPSIAKLAAEQYLRTWIKQHALPIAQQILTES